MVEEPVQEFLRCWEHRADGGLLALGEGAQHIPQEPGAEWGAEARIDPLCVTPEVGRGSEEGGVESVCVR